ncbi:aldehyde dehydrogenase [Microvirga sp. SRT01]|uniref:Aldehyde dehydrogenase n=1 Tax=Sphingomonas longa TaxID=2778730 RepID=A0ABS2DA54_9SPHN|nr:MULTISPECIES: aldehyde dehydrogenase family protein [Alphaproteobacteria]MBM6577824.1 aldehyde dehydrogenase [Sphingomonas sp. BT552]MBR7710866.1 aldehyde dehydrogenase [Microvirga sp. SRT01]
MEQGNTAFSLPEAGLVIGDKYLKQGSAGTHEHRYAATGEVQAVVPVAGASDVERAVAAAARALPGWRATRPAVRRDLLFRLANLVEAHGEEFAWIGAREVGSPISGVRAIPGKFAAWTKYAAGWADKLEGRVVSTFQDDTVFDYTLAEPFGVVGMIITWNGPLMGLAMKLGPALAAGNTLVIKPPELTPFTAYRLLQMAEQAGIPPGVLNLVTGGAEAGEALVRHPDVQKIAFTGGITTARRIAATIAPLMKPAIYELGGKSANLVFADADLDLAVRHSARQPLFLAGQGCVLPTRLLVQDSIADAFVERVVAEVESLRIGDPVDAETEFGPVVNEGAQQRLLSTIDAARERGDGRVVTGGARPASQPGGYYVAPTVFADVDPASPLGQEECFGPVLSILRFRDEDEAVRIANGTQFGLGAYIHSTHLGRTLRLAHRLHAGTIQVNGAPTARENAPFGGSGLSGYGREGGLEGLAEFIRTKNVAIA